MLKLRGIDKDYIAGERVVNALRDVSLDFRKSEFVAVLGPSGCGKTTLLNLIGGLDRYTRGDLVINGKSTKSFTDAEWDAYRNHTVGFVFQSYNLIPHQTVLANVELALTLTGVSREERRRRACDVLKRVGLEDQLYKKPNQMSGGQMQRVAIARALVNDPDILLADEPTGALDSETSRQVIGILKEVASDRLVVMVTHNPELADLYATRVIKLLDGRVVDDTMPVTDDIAPPAPDTRVKQPSMSFLTALSLSLNNLLTKKTRTILVAFAGSIGIIGIALILSFSTGVQNYIYKVEEETLSSYPITITGESLDTAGLLASLANQAETRRSEHEEGYVYSGDIMISMMSLMLSEVKENDIASFKARVDADEEFLKRVSGVSYSYPLTLNIWTRDEAGKPVRVNPTSAMDNMMGMNMSNEVSQYMNTVSDMMVNFGGRGVNVWAELMNNETLLSQQYDVVAGGWPQNEFEVVLIINQNYTISDLTLYTLGIKDQNELNEMFKSVMLGESFEIDESKYSYDDLLSLKFNMVLPTDYYVKDDITGRWIDKSSDDEYMRALLADAPEVKVVGILRPGEDSIVSSMNGGSIGYLSKLTEYTIEAVNQSEIVKAQLANPEIDVFTMTPFKDVEVTESTGAQYGNIFSGGFMSGGFMSGASDMANLTDAERALSAQLISAMTSGKPLAIEDYDLSGLTEEKRAQFTAFISIMNGMGATQTPSATTLKENLNRLGVCDLQAPNGVNIYPRDFDAKEWIQAYIEAYNAEMIDTGREGAVIRYADYIGLFLSGVTTIIDAIAYVLIAFVAISLVVSSIMIGVITYISVLERTKEIGILRAMGASKRDISRVFNAETLIVGFLAGGLGILVSWLLTYPANWVIGGLTDIPDIATLPIQGALILVGISMFLTLIAGLIPSRLAAKRDPVVALRSE